MKAADLRSRVVLTNCLSVCPTDACAVAFLGFGAAPTVACVDSYAQMEATLDEPVWSRTASQVD